MKEAEARISGWRVRVQAPSFRVGVWAGELVAGGAAGGQGHGEAAARLERPGRGGARPGGAGNVPGRGDGGREGREPPARRRRRAPGTGRASPASLGPFSGLSPPAAVSVVPAASSEVQRPGVGLPVANPGIPWLSFTLRCL